MSAGARAAGVLLLAALGGCGGGAPALAPQPHSTVEVVDNARVLDFHARASAFYARLAKRRFNTRATYRDALLRGCRIFKATSPSMDPTCCADTSAQHSRTKKASNRGAFPNGTGRITSRSPWVSRMGFTLKDGWRGKIHTESGCSQRLLHLRHLRGGAT